MTHSAKSLVTERNAILKSRMFLFLSIIANSTFPLLFFTFILDRLYIYRQYQRVAIDRMRPLILLGSLAVAYASCVSSATSYHPAGWRGSARCWREELGRMSLMTAFNAWATFPEPANSRERGCRN